MSKKESKTDCADIYATVKMRFRVNFGKNLSTKEMKEAFLEADYEDIMDEECLDTISVERVEIDG